MTLRSKSFISPSPASGITLRSLMVGKGAIGLRGAGGAACGAGAWAGGGGSWARAPPGKRRTIARNKARQRETAGDEPIYFIVKNQYIVVFKNYPQLPCTTISERPG